MPIYLKHKDVWLRVKEIHTIMPVKRRRRSSKSRSTPTSSMLVVESVDKPKINGLKYVAEIPVSSSRVTRFAAHLFQRYPSITVLIEPRGDDYVARIYARTRTELERFKKLVEQVARDVGVMKEELLEEVEEEEMEEEESEEVE